MKIKTEAWVLKAGNGSVEPAKLEKREFAFDRSGDDLALIEPIFGSWEANMEHALCRNPIDICAERGEDLIVIGNGGVARVLEVGKNVSNVRPGDIGIVFGNDNPDRFGYMKHAMGYDSRGSMGILAKQAVVRGRCIVPIPHDTRISLRQWAAFSLRYVTAWSNWRVAYGAWRLQVPSGHLEKPIVWGWGGGTPFAELSLALHFGASAAMTASSDERLAYIGERGIQPIDRKAFLDLDFQPQRFREDSNYKSQYLAAEDIFLEIVRKNTSGAGVSIFLDYIGSPVFRATLKALARQGVLTSAGWKQGMNISSARAVECIKRHIHVHTHFATYDEARDAIAFAEERKWVPPEPLKVYGWDEINTLAGDYRAGKCGYFPLFQVNAV